METSRIFLSFDEKMHKQTFRFKLDLQRVDLIESSMSGQYQFTNQNENHQSTQWTCCM